MKGEILNDIEWADQGVRGFRAAGEIVPGDPHRQALTLGAVVQGLVAISIEGKIKGDSLKGIVPEAIAHVLTGLSVNKK